MNVLGKISSFTVLRETNLGYMLSAGGEEEYFLHHNETNFRKLNAGDIVDAFIYSDKLARPTASLKTPKVTVDKAGFGTIVDVNRELGAFVNIGSSKDVLLSKDDLPTNGNEWPQTDDVVLCYLRPRGNRLVVKPCNKDDIIELGKEVNPLIIINEFVDGYIYRITPDGVNIVTGDYQVVFVYKTNLRKKYRLGEKVRVKILQKNTDDYTGTLLEDKKETIKSDKDVILEYLNKNHGVMSITEKSESIVIKKVFNMSKKAFKIALGGLYKDRIIEIHDDKIILM